LKYLVQTGDYEDEGSYDEFNDIFIVEATSEDSAKKKVWEHLGAEYPDPKTHSLIHLEVTLFSKITHIS
jgi:hypothetical protein